jgi:tetratricopeptide (TPR) repeat protein
MNVPSIRSGIRILGILLAGSLAVAPGLFAQQEQKPPSLKQDTQTKQAPSAAPQAEPPKSDPEEDSAYKAFYDVKIEAPDQRIKIGEQFMQRYPNSKYASHVYGGLTQAYYAKEQYDKMYAAGDKALALKPDNVDVLVLVGWVIPHNYNPNDMDADRRLDKAEGYLTHALALLPTVAKPDNMTDDQFAKAKTENTAMAHSGLGLVDFRRQNWDKSAKELDQAVKLSAKPDQVDYFVMGRDLQLLKRYAESVDAYQKCAQMPGGVQDRCKQLGNDAKKLATSQSAQPKP